MAGCCKPSSLGVWVHCPGGEVWWEEHSPDPAGTAVGLCEPVGKKSSRGTPYLRPSEHRKMLTTVALCTNTDLSPSAGHEGGNHTQETPMEKQKSQCSGRSDCESFKAIMVIRFNLLLECSHCHVGKHFHRDTTGRRNILHYNRQTATQIWCCNYRSTTWRMHLSNFLFDISHLISPSA